MQRFHRPNLCRLCQFPVVDGGVQLTREELDKVSDWLRRKVGQSLCISDKEEKETSWWICQFCYWDARFMDEHSEENAEKGRGELIWWPQEYDRNYEKFYKGDLLKPCFVNMDENFKSEHLTMNQNEEACDIAISSTSSHSHCAIDESADESCEQINVSSKNELSNEAQSNCIYCGKSFKSEKRMQEHVYRSHQNQAIKCTYRCRKYFKTEKERSEHVKKIHETGFGTSICIYCNKWTPCMNYHIRMHHKNEFIRCSIARCITYFKNEKEKEMHFNQVHATNGRFGKKFKCLFCEKTFEIFGHLRHHSKEKHKEIISKCPFFGCNQYFKTDLELDNHSKETHYEKQIYHCQHCHFKTHERAFLGLHIFRKHGFKRFNCFDCGINCKGFVYKSELKTHYLEQHAEKKTCPHCNKRVRLLRPHTKKQFCKVCSKELPCYGLRKQHRFLEHNTKPTFHCSICSQTFEVQWKLNYHIKRKHNTSEVAWKGIEHKSRGFSCEMCRKYFRSQEQLRRHIVRVHTSKLTSCDLCKRTFSTKGALVFHMKKMHLLVRKKEFGCLKCPSKFYSKGDLKKHWMSFHDENYLVECEKCNEIMSKSSLATHNICFH